ncbi:hypothetical protein SCLCIDRAFT_32443 [Scleroderma citrinum Foug A]|uniref:Uncharacterized protein n=1 Tax=Scleroderma citrinum Foug A TaxID=1036808 RepID=A0A0C3CVV9_9AGAM|nr:hypothetical protein SCLCIDRAFT_32443 [Scleroderma citrinum Foug A]
MDGIEPIPSPWSSTHSCYVCTESDGNNLFCQYHDQFPSYDPENMNSMDQLCDGPMFQRTENDNTQCPLPHPLADCLKESYFTPFLNATVWHLMGWFYNSSTQKLLEDLNGLVHTIILANNFDCKDLQEFSMQRETWRLDEAPCDPSSLRFMSDGWHTASIPICLPCEKVKQPEDVAPEFRVEGLHYCKITEVVKSAFEEPATQMFHTVPYKLFWQLDKTCPPEYIITELYMANAMLQEHENIKSSPVTGCNLETVIAAIMLWSNSTHLASFGNAALWPIYLFLRNQSKYTQAKPTSFAAHHLAYIPKLSDTIQDFYMKTFSTSTTSFLLNSEFLNAYKNGMVIKFPDGIFHQVFLHLFTYAADYPEKILLTCMKFLRNCPCPHCLITKDKICKLGMKIDWWVHDKKACIDDGAHRWLIKGACKAMFDLGCSIASKAVEGAIGAKSLVPMQNAFLDKLSNFSFNFYSILVPDFMHEFELGMWKAALTHLICILYTAGDDAVQQFNAWFRLVPTFRCDTIQRFSANVSGLTKLTARDFEDILQCSIPVSDGLLPELYNSIILNLLFELTTWHQLHNMPWPSLMQVFA